MCGIVAALPMSGSAFVPHAPASRSCAESRVEWNAFPLTSEVPKSPSKQVTVAPVGLRQPFEIIPETKPSPSTTNALGSITFVEPVGWMTSTPGASSSATSTSSGASSGVSPFWPAMYVYETALWLVWPALSEITQLSPSSTSLEAATLSTSRAQVVESSEPDGTSVPFTDDAVLELTVYGLLSGGVIVIVVPVAMAVYRPPREIVLARFAATSARLSPWRTP